jgi:hypothetical protein
MLVLYSDGVTEANNAAYDEFDEERFIEVLKAHRRLPAATNVPCTTRPEGCQKFPHVVRGNGSIVSRMWEPIDRACYCPIVYNSLGAFKDEMEFKR